MVFVRYLTQTHTEDLTFRMHHAMHGQRGLSMNRKYILKGSNVRGSQQNPVHVLQLRAVLVVFLAARIN